MISTFGPTAERYARGLGDIDAVVTEPNHLVPAYLEALRRRERGESFYGMLLVDDARVALAYGTALSIVDQFADFELRERAFSMLSTGAVNLGSRLASEVWSEPLPLAAVEFLRLASAMLVRSYAEFTALVGRSGGVARPVERVLVEPPLPEIVRVRPERPAVVIWAPNRPSPHLALHLSALAEFPGDVWCVAADTTHAPPHARVIAADDARVAQALASAGCIVCAEPSDPGAGVAFARRGYGIVAPLTAGVHEFVPDAVVWDAANATTLYKAVARALGRPASTVHAQMPPARVPVQPPAPMERDALPLVSVLIPTFNRPDDLRRVLAAVGAQTYPFVEAVVVNDCGSPVDDVVAAFPFARLIEHEQNGGSVAGFYTAMQAARGDYVEFLPDDDSIYPDHIERIMFALLRAGAKVAHANGMLRYVERTAAGEWRTTGVNATLCSETLTPASALVATPVSVNGVIQHRSVFDEIGWWLPDSVLADLELHMRQGPRYVFVHADDVTFEFREHAGNQAKAWDFPTELLRIYTDVHPVADRPTLAAYRQATHAAMAARVPGQPAFPPTLRVDG